MVMATSGRIVQGHEGVPGAQLYSNPYSNAGEKLQTWAIRSERQTLE
jgi:hypothetical protein